MAFKLFVRREIAERLDETYQFEQWANDSAGQDYYDIHCSVIDERETSVPTIQHALSGTGKRILESGCGTGRWMAYFERLGHLAFGVDDSAMPLRLAKQRAPSFRLVRGDAVVSPFKTGSFDAVFSSYVAEHFENGPEPLFREIHRVLKPDGLILVVVPYNNLFRRLFTNRVLQGFYAYCGLTGRDVAFTELHFSRAEMDGFLTRSGFVIERVEPDDFKLPWAKGLSVDLGRFIMPRPFVPGSWEVNGVGQVIARTLNSISPWICCSGIFYVARAAK